MQHWYLLKQIEQDIMGMDKNHLARMRLLLQSDLWSAKSRLDDRNEMAPGQVQKFEAERDSIELAIGRIEKRIQGLMCRMMISQQN